MKSKTLLTILGMTTLMGCASVPIGEPEEPQAQSRTVSIGQTTYHISEEREEVFHDGSLMVTAQVDDKTWIYRVEHGCDGGIAREIVTATDQNPRQYIAAMNDAPINDGLDSLVFSNDSSTIALYKVNGNWRGTNTDTEGMQETLELATQFMDLARDVLNVESRYDAVPDLSDAFHAVFRNILGFAETNQVRTNSEGQLVLRTQATVRYGSEHRDAVYSFSRTDDGYQLRVQPLGGRTTLMTIDEVQGNLRIQGAHTEFMETDDPENPICYDRSILMTSNGLFHLMSDAREQFDRLRSSYDHAVLLQTTGVVDQFSE